MLFNHLNRTGHHCERLGLTTFSLPQSLNRAGVRRVAGEVESADAFDGENLSIQKQPARMAYRAVAVFKLTPALIRKIKPRAAFRAGRRLGVKSAVVGIFVLGAARVPHRKLTHRRLRAVIRHVLDDRKSRAAIDAVDERVTKAPVTRVE